MIPLTIFGSSGFIGSHLAKAAKTKGYPYNTPSRDTHLDGQYLGHVIYAIGLTADFRTRPFETIEAHVTRLADILRHTTFDSFLYLSSTRVYGNNHLEEIVSEDNDVTVNTIHPSDLYNLSKLMGESLVLQSHPNTRVARLSNVYGTADTSGNFLNSIIQEALKGHIALHTSLDSCKDYIAIEQVLEAIWHIVFNRTQRVYNVASGINTTHNEIVGKLVEITNCAISVADNAIVSKFPPISIRRLKSEMEFAPPSVLDSLPMLVEAARHRQ